MKRLLLFLLLFFSLQTSCLGISEMEIIVDENFVIYSPLTESWSTGGIIPDGIVLSKKVQYGNGAYSEYFHHNNKLAFALTSDCEFVKNGTLVSVNNNELKYSKIIYSDNKFVEVSLTSDELKNIFPEAEIIEMSNFKLNKLSIKKPLFEKKNVLLVNNTKKYYYNPTCTLPKSQTSPIKGFITLYKYGKYSFKHFGEHKGNFLIQVKL